jgi:diguanylate cyclase (GGDEF)-like protein
VLVEFAHTLGTDFSLADILDRLVRRVVDVLPVTGAGVMLMETDGELHFVAASNSTIHQIEALQREYNEGPCIESFRTGQPVAVPDLSTDQTFPQFSPHAFEAGLAAVFTFPLQFEQRRLGALDLYRDQPGDLEDGDMHAAQVLADVAAAYLSNARARKEASEHLAVLRHDTLHDALTGLPNRTLFAERLNHAVAGARRSRLPVAVLFVDLDRFKAVNDRFGHRVGDLLLKLVSDRLTRCLRPGDTLARFAGDEFMILCENLARPSDAEGLAHRIGVALRDPFVVHGRSLEVTASVGIAFSGKGRDVPDSLLHDADLAMYEAKAAGGASHRVVDRGVPSQTSPRAVLAHELPSALRRRLLSLAYQPIARARDGAVVGVEALLRWRHAARGWISPEVMIPVAEESGLINSLGEWVLEQACTDFMRWSRDYGPVVGHVAVNISAHQILHSGFGDVVARIVADTGIEPLRLHLEVTESLALGDTAYVHQVLRDLKDLGVRLSLDDFGAGYSSLTYLKSFPFDSIKIDRSLITDISDGEPAASAIVGSVIKLGRALDLTVVAEGVETAGELAYVGELGCDLVQGYHLSRPLSSGDLERLVLARVRTGSDVRLPLPG